MAIAHPRHGETMQECDARLSNLRMHLEWTYQALHEGEFGHAVGHLDEVQDMAAQLRPHIEAVREQDQRFRQTVPLAEAS